MRKACALSIAVMLSACQNPDIGAYHHAAAHPYKVTEASTRLRLDRIPDGGLYDAVQAFAAERPNEGSSFIVSAPTDAAVEIRGALIRAGVDPRDIRVVPEGQGEIVRTDRFARVENCNPAVTAMDQKSYFLSIDDGWRRDNSDARTLGCSIRRNVVEMVDDPRSLVGPVKNEGRDGGRAATIHQAWTKGDNPASKTKLDGGSTTNSVLSGGGR